MTYFRGKNIINSNTQLGFLKRSYTCIRENTRLLYDLMDYTECRNIPGLLVLIDFEKAFDSISWTFVYKELEFLGLAKNIIEWVKILKYKILCICTSVWFFIRTVLHPKRMSSGWSRSTISVSSLCRNACSYEERKAEH